MSSYQIEGLSCSLSLDPTLPNFESLLSIQIRIDVAQPTLYLGVEQARSRYL
ncbi:hypothetical protein P4S72_25330 [Vibrio sp. PP-XX7]